MKRGTKTEWALLVLVVHAATANGPGVRKMKTGPEVIDLFAFLTTEPSEPVKSVQPNSISVILTTEEERDVWMRGPWDEPKGLQRALDVALSIAPHASV